MNPEQKIQQLKQQIRDLTIRYNAMDKRTKAAKQLQLDIEELYEDIRLLQLQIQNAKDQKKIQQQREIIKQQQYENDYLQQQLEFERAINARQEEVIQQMQQQIYIPDDKIHRLIQAEQDKNYIQQNEFQDMEQFDEFQEQIMRQHEGMLCTIVYSTNGNIHTRSYTVNDKFYAKANFDTGASFYDVFVNSGEQATQENIVILSITFTPLLTNAQKIQQRQDAINLMKADDSDDNDLFNKLAGYSRPAGQYLNKLNKSGQDLTRYQIGKTIREHERLNTEHCLIYTLRMSGQLDDEQLNAVKECIVNNQQKFSQKDIKKLPIPNAVIIRRYKPCGTQTVYKTKGCEPVIEIALYEGHYFINDYLNDNVRSLGLVMQLDKDGLLEEIKVSNNLNKMQVNKMQVMIDDFKIYDTEIEDEEGNVFESNNCQKIIQGKEQEDQEVDRKCRFEMKDVICADFEAFVVDDQKRPDGKPHFIQHVPFMMNWRQGSDNYTANGQQCFKLGFIEYIKKRYAPLNAKTVKIPDVLVYYHNLSYDAQFIVQAGFQLNDTIITNGRLINFSIRVNFQGKNYMNIVFRDSVMLFGCKLSELSEMFNLEGTKEIFPYLYYTQALMSKQKYGDIKEASKYLEGSATYSQFIDSIQKQINHGRKQCVSRQAIEDNNMFNLIDYCNYYCKRDVNLLYDSIVKFHDILEQKPFEMEMFNYLSISSLSVQYQKKMGCFDDVYASCGLLRRFLNQFIVGGRCMSAQNKMINEKIKIQALDAKSLYPTAMYQTYYPAGKCYKMSNEQIMYYQNQDNLFKITQKQNSMDQSTLYMQVRIYYDETHKKLDFPLLQQTNDNGAKNFVNECEDVYFLNDIQLQDAITYQHYKYEIIGGVIYSQRNYKIQGIIKNMYDERAKAKKANNPIQSVYKLMMNSSYGKTIEKDHDTEIKIVYGDKWLQDITRELHRFDYVEHINGDQHIIHYTKQTNTQFTYPQVGVQILAMSKRLMNRVMVLAQDLHIQIFYQDTDSMHIESEKTYKLEREFERLYGFKLVGKDLLQYGSDLKCNKQDEEDGWKVTCSQQLIAVGKKAYIDEMVLERKVGEVVEQKIAYSNRLKGVGSQCFSGDEKDMIMYQKLYDGETLIYDLADGKACMKKQNFGCYQNMVEFKRAISFGNQKFDIKNSYTQPQLFIE